MQSAETVLDVLRERGRRGLPLDELYRQLRDEQLFLGATEEPKTKDSQSPKEANTAARIRDTQAKLDDLLLRYTEKHPDVVALRQTLADLQQRRQAEIEAIRRGDPGAAERLGITASPVYQNVQLQYDQARVDMSGIQAEIADRQAKIADLRSIINTAPELAS